MTFVTLRLEVDSAGVAVVWFDDPAKPMNVVAPQWLDELAAVVERVATDGAIKGAVLTSAKSAFMAGADLKHILELAAGGISRREAFEVSQRASLLHRRLETCGKPFVAALNGLALGGGYELALACHYRVLVDDPKAVVGLPEVTVGLLPGSGGTQRLPRLIPVGEALSVLLDGKPFAPAEALRRGLVDAVVPVSDLLQTARNRVLDNPSPIRHWDVKGYPAPGGLQDPKFAGAMTLETARVVAQTNYNYPAPIAILDCVFQGFTLPFDKALRVESGHFAQLLTGPVARNLVRTSFVNKGAAMKLARRPEGVPTSAVKVLGVLGAGLMGSGVAHAAAAVGIEVILLDTTLENAERGKAAIAKSLAKAVERGSRSREAADRVLVRVRASVDYQDLRTCDLVIEAVFEDPKIKAEVTSRAESAMPRTAIFASNTSTLPITGLACACARPEQFIGLHFFSPVERMPLVEVIVGAKTSQATLARSLDFVGQLEMVPILVRDARGFYTSRVFQTFIHEGMRMLEDGVEPALVENAAKFAGFPVGPLALVDEVTLELPWKIVQEAEAALGSGFVKPCAYEVMRRMLDLERRGKRYGKGFYEYSDGGRKRLWRGLAAVFPPAAAQPDIEELKKRFLYIQSLETARCLEEGVLTHAADGDLGAVLGWGFPAWTGGTLSLIDTLGVRTFVRECREFARKLGPRFAPSAWLESRAKRNEAFLSP